MSKRFELRNPDEARSWLLHGLRLVRVRLPETDATLPILEWAFEMASEGYPMPPLGALADAGLLGLHSDWTSIDQLSGEIEVVSPLVMRRYEDYVTAKLLVDASFRRGTDAALRFQGRERRAAFAYLMHRMLRRANFAGVVLSPSVIRGLIQDRRLAELIATADDEQMFDRLTEEYKRLTEAIRRIGEVLVAADILELERGIAISGFGQRLAFRQVISAAESFQQMLPKTRPRAKFRRQEVATSITHHDSYPVGGFGAITSHGTLESLLNSQLAYMEDGDRPDLFDIKYLRGELLYYSRDENQFLRRRYRYSFLFSEDLVRSRIKRDLPWQDIIAVLATTYTVVRQLIEWLSTESLHFEFVFFGPKTSDEELLLKILFQDLTVTDVVSVRRDTLEHWQASQEEQRRRLRCRSLLLCHDPPAIPIDTEELACLATNRGVPSLLLDGEPEMEGQELEPQQAWRMAVKQLLEHWV